MDCACVPNETSFPREDLWKGGGNPHRLLPDCYGCGSIIVSSILRQLLTLHPTLCISILQKGYREQLISTKSEGRIWRFILFTPIRWGFLQIGLYDVLSSSSVICPSSDDRSSYWEYWSDVRSPKLRNSSYLAVCKWLVKNQREAAW